MDAVRKMAWEVICEYDDNKDLYNSTFAVITVERPNTWSHELKYNWNVDRSTLTEADSSTWWDSEVYGFAMRRKDGTVKEIIY